MIAIVRGRAARLAVAVAAGGLLLLTAPGQLRADDAIDAEVGIAGSARTGAWTPVAVGNDAAAVHLSAEDPDGQFVRSPAARASSGRSRFQVRLGRPQAPLLVETTGTDGRAVFRRLPVSAPLPSSEQVLLVIGDLPAAERAARLLAGEDGPRLRVVKAADPRSLAAGASGMTPRDFDGIDAAVVCGSVVAAAQADQLARDVLGALDGWVRRGGRLVSIAGARSANAATEVARWLPGPPGIPGGVERLVPLRRATAIETFGRADRTLEKAALAGLEVPLLADAAKIDGVIEAFEGTKPADLPLVVRSARGFGTVTWIGLDLDQGAFRTWQGTDRLLAELLVGRAAGKSQAGRAGETRTDTLDLAGQLRQAIDRFPGVSAIPFELIAAIGLLYVACLYPLDWWLVSRGGGRPWLAWLSLPVLVAAVSGLAWATADAFKGDQWRSSRAFVTDIDTTTGFVRGYSWAGVWSPVNATINVSASPGSMIAAKATHDTAVTWYGASGRALGGPDAPSAHPSLAATGYRYGATLAALEGIPIAAASSRLFEAEWTADWADPPVVTATLEREAQGTLRGSIESGLPFVLEDCVLVHGGWLYDVGRLTPGVAFDPAGGRGPRSLAGALTRRTAVKDRDVPLRWDVAGQDIDRILEVAGFHAAAGGASYTSLESGRLGRLDLSTLVTLDRAVLVGRGPAGTQWHARRADEAAADIPDPPSSVQADGLWRIVLPIGASRR
ncbi:MAG: hypothetical protein ACK6DO_02220 [Planctomycetia bacterium]